MTMHTMWSRFRTIPGWIWPLAGGVIIAILPYLGLGYGATRQIELTLILALIVGGLNLSFGYAGELALGQVAMYAAGAYASGMAAKAGVTEIWIQLLIGMAAALIVGLISGIPGLRLGSWSLAMTSFFLILLVPDVLSIFKDSTGGRNGLAGITPATLFGEPMTARGYYLTLVIVTVLWFVVLRNLIVSRHGTALRVLKQSPVLAVSVGISVFRLKLTAYALGALPAGVAGVFFANLDLFISPEAFSFSFAMTVLAASIFGGSASIYGAVVGAAVLQFGMNQSTNFAQFGLLISGAFLLLGGVAFTGGLAGLMRGLIRRWDRAGAKRDTHAPAEAAPEGTVEIPSLRGAAAEVHGVSKAFGGNQALRDVTLSAAPGSVTALIGPNGSGKTTLLNMISGFYRTDTGTITLNGEAIQREPSYKVARIGVSRTFQTPVIPDKLTVVEAVEAGAYAARRIGVLPAVLRSPGFRRVTAQDRAAALRALAMVGLSESRDELAASLPLGHRRLLEVARCLVAEPQVLLLDEVASGLDEDELEVLESLIRRLADAGMTVILVEHNFQLVLRLADDIYVLALGEVIAHGSSAEIEGDRRVLEEYLGISAGADDGTHHDSTPMATDHVAGGGDD